MAKVIILNSLKEEVFKIFKKESETLFTHMRSLEEQPKKGKIVGAVKNIIIKEIKYGKFRFYCILDGHTLKFGKEEDLVHLLIKFIRMSDKNDQQKTIDEIKKILQTLGF